MVVEGRDLVDLGHGQFQLGAEGDDVRRGDMTVGILNAVQVLDQQVTPARVGAEQGGDFRLRLRILLPPLELAASLAFQIGGA